MSDNQQLKYEYLYYESDSTVVYENESILKDIGEYLMPHQDGINDPNSNARQNPETPRQSTAPYDNEHVLQDIGEYILPPSETENDPNSNGLQTPETPRQTQRQVIQDDYDDGLYSLARPSTCPTKSHGVLQKAPSENKPTPKEGLLQKKNVRIAAGVILFLIVVGGVLPLVVDLTNYAGITNIISFIWTVILFT